MPSDPLASDVSPRVLVLGVGEGGALVVQEMIAAGSKGMTLVVSPPEAPDDLRRLLEGHHLVLLAACMGDRTGTAPTIAWQARKLGLLSIGVVSEPFDYEGGQRRQAAAADVARMLETANTLVVVSNNALVRRFTEDTTFPEAFRMVRRAIQDGIRGIAGLLTRPADAGLTFADIRTALLDGAKALVGTGEAAEADQAAAAAMAAIGAPRLIASPMLGADSALVNITGSDVTLFEVEQVASRVREAVGAQAEILVGTSVDQELGSRVRVTVVATGLGRPDSDEELPDLADIPISDPPPVGTAPPRPTEEEEAEQAFEEPSFLRRIRER